MALADGEVTQDEIARLEGLCEALALGPSSREAVVAAARALGSVDLAALIARLRDSELRFALLVDLVDVATADGSIAAGEDAELEALADELGITRGQLAMTRRFVAEQRELGSEPLSREALAAIAGLGIPVAALAVLAPLGVSLAVGLGIAAALGAGSYVSVKWLAGKVRGGGDDPDDRD
jgi:uncharacterized tellurite resistance protein B-like protein